MSEFRLGYLSSPFWKKNVNILASVKVRILECAVKDIFYTCGVKHERKRESEGIRNGLNAGQRRNIYVESNGCRYIILRETVSEVILCIRRRWVGAVE